VWRGLRTRPSVTPVALAVACLTVAGLFAGCGRSSRAETLLAEQPQLQFGYIRGLVHAGGEYKLRVALALWLTGDTGLRAAVEDGTLAPGARALPDDVYIRDVAVVLTYRLPAGAEITVVTNEQSRVGSERISARELFDLLRDRNPSHIPLLSKNFGFWIQTSGDSVIRLEQQYHP
jgi:hypothetical protein